MRSRCRGRRACRRRLASRTEPQREDGERGVEAEQGEQRMLAPRLCVERDGKHSQREGGEVDRRDREVRESSPEQPLVGVGAMRARRMLASQHAHGKRDGRIGDEGRGQRDR
ncbi:MAG: hypothetical protein ACK55I_09835, partial [bacterium]